MYLQMKCGKRILVDSVMEEMECEVSFIENPTSFFMGLRKYDNLFDKVEKELEKAWPPKKVLSAPQVGSFCLSEYQGEPYRAEIREVREDDVTVFFMDFGNSESKGKDEVYEMSKELEEIPRLGIHCCLPVKNPLGPDACWDESAKGAIADLVDGEIVETTTVTFHAADNGEGAREVTVLHGKISVLDHLVEKELVEVLARSLEYLLSEEPSFQEPEEVIVTEVLNPAFFFVTLKRDEITKELKRLLDSTPVSIPLKKLDIGRACIAQLGQTVRAEIREIVDTGEVVEVYMVDLGEVVKIPRGNVFDVTPELASIPKQALRCHLLQAPPSSPARFHVPIKGDKAMVRFVQRQDDGSYDVKMCEDGSEKRLLSSSMRPTPTVDLGFHKLGAACAVALFKFSTIPDSFTENLDGVEKTIKEILETKSWWPMKEPLMPGIVGLTGFFDVVCRCEVLTVDSKERKVRIRYVDYGNQAMKAVEDVMEVSEKYWESMSKQSSCILCQLTDTQRDERITLPLWVDNVEDVKEATILEMDPISGVYIVEIPKLSSQEEKERKGLWSNNSIRESWISSPLL